MENRVADKPLSEWIVASGVGVGTIRPARLSRVVETLTQDRKPSILVINNLRIDPVPIGRVQHQIVQAAHAPEAGEHMIDSASFDHQTDSPVRFEQSDNLAQQAAQLQL